MNRYHEDDEVYEQMKQEEREQTQKFFREMRVMLVCIIFFLLITIVGKVCEFFISQKPAKESAVPARVEVVPAPQSEQKSSESTKASPFGFVLPLDFPVAVLDGVEIVHVPVVVARRE